MDDTLNIRQYTPSATNLPADPWPPELTTLEESREPEWHVRLNLTSTVKEGFRVGEITVSCDYTGPRPERGEWTSRIAEMMAIGKREADIANGIIIRSEDEARRLLEGPKV